MAKLPALEESAISYNISDDTSIHRIITAVRKGIPYSLFHKIMETSPFNTLEWSRFLHLSDRTLLRIRQQKKSFDPSSSERILEIYRLYKYGKDIFGSKEKFDSWLETENLALGKLVPKTLLDTGFGIGLLKDELTRIEQGVLA